eukprot:scaffold26367_cov117-Skeletonema_marinoi.AAC.1
MFASKEQRSRKLSWLAPGGKIFFIPRNDSCHYLEGYHDVELGHINRFMKRTSMDVTMLSTEKLQKLFDDHLLQTNAIQSPHVNNATLLRVRSILCKTLVYQLRKLTF